MDTSGSIRNALRSYLGDARYRKFVRAFVRTALERGELVFWQHRDWEKFTAEVGIQIPPEVDKLRDIFTRCYVHDVPLELNTIPIRKGVLSVRYSREFEERWREEFPYALDYVPDGPHHSGRSSIRCWRCPQCWKLFNEFGQREEP